MELSAAQLSYLDELLSGFDGLGEEWEEVCCDIIEGSRVFTNYDAYEVFTAWIRKKTKH